MEDKLRLYHNKGINMQDKFKFNFWTLTPIIISLVALSIVLYRDFLQGPKLHSSINQIIMMRTLSNKKQVLLQDMLLDDLLSTNMSQQALKISKSNPLIGKFVQSKNRDKLIEELLEFNEGKNLIYSPPSELVAKYINDKRYYTSFYVPLVIYNFGGKVAHVSSLIMIITSLDNIFLKWAYTPYVEINHSKFLDRSKNQKDVEIMSKLFTGVSISPNESIRVDPWFMPKYEPEDPLILRNNISPGKYIVTISGFNAEGKEFFRTNPVEYNITEEYLIKTFFGKEKSDSFNIDKNISSAIQ